MYSEKFYLTVTNVALSGKVLVHCSCAFKQLFSQCSIIIVAFLTTYDTKSGCTWKVPRAECITKDHIFPFTFRQEVLLREHRGSVLPLRLLQVQARIRIYWLRALSLKSKWLKQKERPTIQENIIASALTLLIQSFPIQQTDRVLFEL